MAKVKIAISYTFNYLSFFFILLFEEIYWKYQFLFI